MAIQVFSGEDLRERNITTIGDLVSSVPGAQEGFRQSNGSRFYNLRGNVTQNGDFPIGYYLDDTPFIVTNFGIAPPVRFIDMSVSRFSAVLKARYTVRVLRAACLSSTHAIQI